SGSAGVGGRAGGGPGGAGAGGQAGGGGAGGAAGSGGAVDGGAAGGPAGVDAGGGAGMPAGLPTRAAYLELLYRLCDQLVSAQITGTADPSFGAIVSPSTNPEDHPIHSRAAEAVYPLAVAWKHSQQDRYAVAAVRL